MVAVRRALTIALAGALAAGCGAGGGSAISAARAPQIIRWGALAHLHTPIDVAIGRTDGLPVIAANGGLYLLHLSGRLSRFAPAYRNAPGESYIAVPPAGGRGCSFGQNAVYAIRLHRGPGVTRITTGGRVSRFASIGGKGLIDGITFDDGGLFHYRLLVTVEHGPVTTVDAIDCRGRVTTITSSAPRIEGGIAVAPRTFGRFGGDLIAPDELSGRIYAISPSGRSQVLSRSGLPNGQDVGVESETFLPANPKVVLLMADRLTPRNPHPGDDLLLELAYPRLIALGARPNDLLLSTEGGGLTEVVSCGAVQCRVRLVARGPSRAHIEGHVGFVATPR